MKMSFKVPVVSVKQIMEGTLCIIQYLLDDKFIEEWDWTGIAAYLTSPDIELRWYFLFIFCQPLTIITKQYYSETL